MTQLIFRTTPFAALIFGFAAILLWGLTPAATELAVRYADPLAIGALRSLLAAPLLALTILLFRVSAPKGRPGWTLATVAGMGGFVGFPVLFSFGLAATSTAHAALIIASAPIMTGLIGFAVTRDWPKPIWWLGAGIAFAGVAVLIAGREIAGEVDRAQAATLSGDLLCLAATAAAAAGYVAGGRLSAHIGGWASMTWSLLIASAVLFPILLFVPNDPGRLLIAITNDWNALLPILYLSVCGTVLGYALWFHALERGGVARIAPIQFAQPLISLIVAVFVLHEALSIDVAVATGLILSGVALARRA